MLFNIVSPRISKVIVPLDWMPPYTKPGFASAIQAISTIKIFHGNMVGLLTKTKVLLLDHELRITNGN
jgi:hypothetical protein